MNRLEELKLLKQRRRERLMWRLDRLALLPDGRPAWQLVRGFMKPGTFMQRVRRGWDAERIVREPVKERAFNPLFGVSDPDQRRHVQDMRDLDRLPAGKDRSPL